MSRNQATDGLGTFRIVREVRIEADRDAVWRALTAGVDDWWAYRLAADESMMHLEPRPGGAFVESWGDRGEGVVWGSVQRVEHGRLLRLSGSLGMSELPVSGRYTYELEGDGMTTRLRLVHHCFGVLDPNWPEEHERGWQELLDRYLRAYLERGRTWRVEKASPERR